MTEPNQNIPELPTQEQKSFEKISFVDRYSIHPLAFAAASLVIIFLLYQVGGGVLTLVIAGVSPITSNNVWLMRWLTVIGQIGFIFVPTLILTRLFANRIGEVFRFKVPGIFESIFAFICLVSLQFIFDAYLFFQERIPVPQLLREFLEPLKKAMEEAIKIMVHAGSPVELIAVVFIVAVVPAIVEELLFRGLIQKVFERLLSPIAAAIITGTIFGMFHLNLFEMVPLIGIGVFLGILRYRSQSLWLPISVHFFNNFIAIIAVYYGLSDENLLIKQESAPDARTMLFRFIVFGILFVISFRAYLQVTRKIPRNIP